MTLRPGWLLWADWCRATGRTSLAVTQEALDAFCVQVSGDHRSAIRATVRETGMAWPLAEAKPDPWAAVEASMLTLDVALRRCPRGGWPGGYSGRRDAWLLVLTRGLRMTRREALALRGRDLEIQEDGVIVVVGRRIERGDDPASCWACVATRWLACLIQEDRWSRSTVREAMILAPTVGDDHDCFDPEIPANQALVLAPAIDQYGWAETYRPMSPRGVTAVLARRCSLDADPWPLADSDRGPREPATGGWTEVSHEQIEEACAAADEVNARVEALLDDTETALGAILARGRGGRRAG